MASTLTWLRSIRRLIVVVFILLTRLVLVWPCRALFRQEHQGISKYLKPRSASVSTPELMKQTLERLGPTYIKFGQFMSIRPDLIPSEYCNEFRKLQDKVQPFAFSEAEKELEQEYKRPYTDIFSEFDESPYAAASISQVHRARLKTGQEVAVKVQRPGIREQMVSDILIMLFFANLIERFVPSLRKNQPVMLVREFSRWTDRELYFRQEGKNALHFAYFFRNFPGVRIPKIYREHTTKKVLVMEYIHGTNILDESIDPAAKRKIAHLIADSMLKQIFVDGFFHGDPHAGNILLVDENTIAYLDFGIVGYLSEDLRAATFDILYGMSEADAARVLDSFLELCCVDVQQTDLTEYRRQMNEVLSELRLYQMAGIPFSQLMERFLNTSLEFGIPIPHEFVPISKAVATLEGTCLSLDPDIKIVEYLKPFVQKYMVKTNDFDQMLKQLKAGPFETERVRRLAVKHGARVLGFFENPTVRVAGDEFSSIRAEMDKASVNIAYGFIIAALIVFAASSGNENQFEVWIKTCFHLPVMPLLPLLSLGIAAVLLVWLVIRNRTKRCSKS